MFIPVLKAFSDLYVIFFHMNAQVTLLLLFLKSDFSVLNNDKI